MKDKKPLDWVPIWCDKHLFGSMRYELEPAERSVWVDLLVLAGKDNGYIRANEGCPYPSPALAGMLNIPVELLDRTVEKCIDYGKLKRMDDETLYLTGWETYKLTRRHQRRFEQGKEETMSAKTDTMSAKAVPRDRERDREREKSKSKRKNKKLVPKGTCESIGEKWNRFAEKNKLPQIKGMTKTRIGYLNQRWKEHFSKKDGISFDTLLDIIGKSPFLIGKTSHNFHCTFDWIIRPTNFQKIIEGNYLDRRYGELKRWLDEYGEKE